MNRLEADPAHKQELSRARNWVADHMLPEDGDTVRSLRLRKGISQTQLAELIGTSQAQVARIEKGNVDLHRSTCKKLREALGVTADELDSMLDHQESVFLAKAKR